MPLAFFKTLTVSAASTTAVAAAQTLVGAGDMALAVGAASLPNIGQRPTLTSTGNISGVNFTIYGTGTNGLPLQSTLAGPNNNTVTFPISFKTITRIAADGAVGTNTSAGYAAISETSMWATDPRMNPFQIGFGVVKVSGAPLMTMQHTFDQLDSSTTPGTPGQPFDQGTAQWFNHPSVNAAAATTDGNYGKPVSAVRFMVSGEGVARVALYQSVGLNG